MEWDGLGKFEADLKQMEEHVKDVKRVVKDHGAKLQQREMRVVPKVTHFLERSITISVTDGGWTATVEPTAHYAAYVEYGTRFMSARPYIRPSFQKESVEFLHDIKKITDDLLT